MIDNRLRAGHPVIYPEGTEIGEGAAVTPAPRRRRRTRYGSLHRRLLADYDAGDRTATDVLDQLIAHRATLLAGDYVVLLRVPVAIVVCAPDPHYADRGAARLLKDEFATLPAHLGSNDDVDVDSRDEPPQH
jgi:hypothetical protein